MSKYIAGVDIGGTTIKFGVLTEDGELLYQTQTKSVIGDPGKMVEIIARMVEEAPYPVSMVGVGTPGTVRLPQNMVSAANLK